MQKLTDALRTGVVILLAIAGIVISVFHIVGHPLSWANEIPSVTLILIGLIAIDFSLERFTSIRRIEKQIESIESFEKINSLPGDVREVLKKSIRDYVNLQHLRKHSKAFNAPFCLVADDLLRQQALLLRSLSLGRLDVSREQTLALHSKMAAYYRERLDAVSETDLDFWVSQSPLAEAYFKRNAEAVRNGTTVTRIFIFSLSDLKNRSEEIVSILERQFKAGIGWGVAISEDLETEVAQSALPLDCALFNGGKAITFFRRREAQRFEAIFLPHIGHENEARISSQKELYQNLIVECWLVNNIFRDAFPGALTEESVKNIRAKTARHNEILNKALGSQVVEDETFVLVASTPDEVKSKVILLADILRRWRESYGYQLMELTLKPEQ